MSYQIFSSHHQGQVVSRECAGRTASHAYSNSFTPPDQTDAAEFESLFNAVAVKRHLEAVGVDGLYIRKAD